MKLLQCELNQGSVVAVTLLYLVCVTAAGAIAEALGKADIRLRWIADTLGLIEAVGKLCAALVGLFLLFVFLASTPIVGSIAPVAFGVVGVFMIVTVLLLAAVAAWRGNRQHSPQVQPVVTQTVSGGDNLRSLIRKAQDIRRKVELIESRGADIQAQRSEWEDVRRLSGQLELGVEAYGKNLRDQTGYTA